MNVKINENLSLEEKIQFLLKKGNKKQYRKWFQLSPSHCFMLEKTKKWESFIEEKAMGLKEEMVDRYIRELIK